MKSVKLIQKLLQKMNKIWVVYQDEFLFSIGVRVFYLAALPKNDCFAKFHLAALPKND